MVTFLLDILTTPILVLPNTLLVIDLGFRIASHRIASMANEGEEVQQPQLVLADKLFLLKQKDVQDIDKVRFKEDVFNFVKEHGIYPSSLSL